MDHSKLYLTVLIPTFENDIAVLRLETFVSIQKYKMIFYIIDSNIHNAAYLCFSIKIWIY